VLASPGVSKSGAAANVTTPSATANKAASAPLSA